MAGLRAADGGEMSGFHPLIVEWFRERFGTPTEPQVQGWPPIRDGKHTLIAAPTGSGKTLSAFLCAIDELVQSGLRGELEDRTRILYVSPLKALANDIRTNLLQPLEEIQHRAGLRGIEVPEIRPRVRTGDTPASERRKMVGRPPHILVTTPESLFILLTSESGRRMLGDVRTVIIDEIHSLARDKRGSHLMLSLERLESLAEAPVQRIGLSATQKPIQDMARYLVGPGRRATIVDVGHRRRLDLGVIVPGDELGAVATGEMWEEVYDRLAGLIEVHRTTLVFTNTRRMAERVAHHLAARVGEESVAAHHGSLSKEIRLDAERRLKSGGLRAVVATASLELGIDVGSIDLVCQIGTTRSIALALQRIGRSGHWKGAIPKGRFFPLSRDELLECAALVSCIKRGELDRILVPLHPLDVLAQQIVAETAARDWIEDELYETFRKAGPYGALGREDFDAVVSMLSEGISTRKGRRGAFLHRDRVNGVIKARRGARLSAITSGGAIPEVADYAVKAGPEELLIGTLDEDFAIESSQGDIFLLGNASWRIKRVESRRGVVRVEDAHGAPPTIPFWLGEAPARSQELSRSLGEIRRRIGELRPETAAETLQEECGLCRRGADQAFHYVQATKRQLGAVPTQDCVVAERFFDEAGGMQLVLHSPFGGRINRAWGLALRKKFCRSFNFELQAAATEDGVNISLSDQHSFPLDSVFSFLSSHNVREVLVQAMLDSPLFPTRWRWNATRALQVLRFRGGKKVPPPFQRMQADDLLAAVFPDSAACLENIVGDIEVPDHPLVRETVGDCLNEAMDIQGLERLLKAIEAGAVRCVAVDTPEPSPFSHQILNANPYAYLDDAPLEERRARAVQTRRMGSREADEMGILDGQAIEQVVREAAPPLRDADELHDALLSLVAVPESSRSEHSEKFQILADAGRTFRLRVPPLEGADSAAGSEPLILWTSAERASLAARVYPCAEFDPGFDPESEAARSFLWERDRGLDRQESIRELVRAHCETAGPVTGPELACTLALGAGEIEIALAALEGQGQILRGAFRPGAKTTEWCDRRLLARIHRLTLGRLRREIEPVSPADFMRFLFRWQHVAGGARQHGVGGLSRVLDQLQGLELPAATWEDSVLKHRVADYTPELLDQLCLSGQYTWARLSRPAARRAGGAALSGPQGEEGSNSAAARPVRPTRLAPVAFYRREQMETFMGLGANGAAEPEPAAGFLSSAARAVRQELGRWGACFLEDLVRATGMLPSQVEQALWELTASGLATADGFDNLRSLIDPKRRRVPKSPWKRAPRDKAKLAGRWSLLRLPATSETENRARLPYDDPRLEELARQLLRRWGVIFRDILARETLRTPWRDLLMIYRRLEARGEVRGGRFVAGLVGEQFALPEALESLRSVRRSRDAGEVVAISAADPLNLTGILLPGPRIRRHPEAILRFREGVLTEEGSPLMARLYQSSTA